jgi:hypothetical protein
VLTSLPQHASHYFQFLETTYGFRLVVANETTVRWETQQVFVQLHYDAHRSFELTLEIGHLAAGTRHRDSEYSLSEILGVAGVPLANRPFFQASTEERLLQSLEQIASLLIQHGKGYFGNEGEPFKRLAEQRDKDCAAYALEQSLKRMRQAADKAWQERDYKRVAALYKEQKSYLSPAEAKRYEIALKRAK